MDAPNGACIGEPHTLTAVKKKSSGLVTLIFVSGGSSSMDGSRLLEGHAN